MVNEDLKDKPGMVIIGNGVSSVIWTVNEERLHSLQNLQRVLTLVEGNGNPSCHIGARDLGPDTGFGGGFQKDLSHLAIDHATDLVLKVRNAKELSTIAAKITQIFPDTRPILREEILRTYDAVFDWRGGLIIVILAGAFFAFIILAWDKATGLSAEEKREIGILKAIGWETSDILLMKFWEGAALSLSAFLMGILSAYLHVFLTSSVLFEPVLKGWSVLYPHFRLTPFINAYQLVTLFFLTVIPYTVATIVPSWRSATIDPDSVMRT